MMEFPFQKAPPSGGGNPFAKKAPEAFANKPEDEGKSTSAEDLNDRIQQVVSQIKEIEQDARAAGVYADRASISSLRTLADDAEAIHSRWVEQEDMAKPQPEHQPAKVIEVKSGRPPEDHSGFNAFGGQTWYPDKKK